MEGQGCTARGERIVGGLRRTVEEEMRRRGAVGYGCSSDEEEREREREGERARESERDCSSIYGPDHPTPSLFSVCL